jgi:hypothetical protein
MAICMAKLSPATQDYVSAAVPSTGLLVVKVGPLRYVFRFDREAQKNLEH